LNTSLLLAVQLAALAQVLAALAVEVLAVIEHQLSAKVQAAEQQPKIGCYSKKTLRRP
jgi:hypothetical protein